MLFKKCSIQNITFGDHDIDDDVSSEDMAESARQKIMYHMKKRDELGLVMQNFFSMLAVCHTCMVESDPLNPQKLKYSASSPDELALVQGAK